MPIPTDRQELIEMIRTSFAELLNELEKAGPGIGHLHCVDDWSVKDLLAVRLWWSRKVVEWIKAGRRGESLDLPAQGYKWKETPRLNNDIVQKAQTQSFAQVVAQLKRAYEHVLTTIDGLDDRELLEKGVFNWTGTLPLIRWISINTARQYTTARTFVRRAQKAR